MQEQQELLQRVQVLRVLQVQVLQELPQQELLQRELREQVLPGELLSQMRIHNRRKKLRHPDFLFRN